MNEPTVPGRVTQAEREVLREWVRNRHSKYVRQAVELANAQLRLEGEKLGHDADFSYSKLRRLREEYEEARKSLAFLDQTI